MAVSGLGTESWTLAKSTCGRGLPTASLGADSVLARAVIAAEDQRFFEHTGYDLTEMTQALHSNQDEDAVLRGASTLSQQVAKNLFLWSGRSWLRKGLEVWFTGLIELCWSKQRILEVYLNTVEWGDGVFGAEAAARAHIGKGAPYLSKQQAA
ncbi:MAG: monofunctional biosynthetic peptidoglycan transglycosylase [Burkholderiales bacterium PBB4]|nr:MAG: monofunctional biosynthetic peptidoglycan transglycosylase [Burkholderiales bacterium PBB4]